MYSWDSQFLLGDVESVVTLLRRVSHIFCPQVTREFLALVKGIAGIDSSQYPETLGRLFIINTPR
jgi:hypothetical protein